MSLSKSKPLRNADRVSSRTNVMWSGLVEWCCPCIGSDFSSRQLEKLLESDSGVAMCHLHSERRKLLLIPKGTLETHGCQRRGGSGSLLPKVMDRKASRIRIDSFRLVVDSALECTVIRDIVQPFDSIDADANRIRKTELMNRLDFASIDPKSRNGFKKFGRVQVSRYRVRIRADLRTKHSAEALDRALLICVESALRAR